MHQDRYVNPLLMCNALLPPALVLVPYLNTSIQPYDRGLAFRPCFSSLGQVLDKVHAFATRLHNG